MNKAQEGKLLKSMRDLCPKPGSGITSITLISPGSDRKPVVLTGETRKLLHARLQKPIGRLNMAKKKAADVKENEALPLTETQQERLKDDDHVPLGTEELQKRLNIIRGMQAVVDHASREVADIKEQLKIAKEKRETAIVDLCIFIRDGEMPLFDMSGNPQSAPGAPGHNPQSSEPWRTVFLSELAGPGIKPAVLAKLAHAKIETVGDLADKTSSDRFHLTDIPGIGPAAAADIEDALEAFWKRQKDQQKSTIKHPGTNDLTLLGVKDEKN